MLMQFKGYNAISAYGSNGKQRVAILLFSKISGLMSWLSGYCHHQSC